MYSWSENLQHEPKIREAYSMLKTQGIVKEDPTYIDQVLVFGKNNLMVIDKTLRFYV